VRLEHLKEMTEKANSGSAFDGTKYWKGVLAVRAKDSTKRENI